MKVHEIKKSVVGGMMETVKQTISQKHLAKATYFLRDKIYSDKLKAAITETVCNAVDEHRKYHIKRPVDIILTGTELCIRDHAMGLSTEHVQKIFFQYFESTKSDSNDGIGGFGIGAKAPGAYSDVYFVVSYFQGKKTMFMSSVNGYESEASTVFSEDIDPAETGICVRIPINKDTIYNDRIAFKKLAVDLFRQIGFYSDVDELKIYFTDDNIDYDEFIAKNDKYKEAAHDNFKAFQASPLKELRITTNKYYIKDTAIIYGRYRYRYNSMNDSEYEKYQFISNFFNSKRFMAYDGDVCYRIDADEKFFKELDLDTENYNYIIFFKRGELSITPSRESIDVTEETKAWLKNKVKLMKNHFLSKTRQVFENEIANNAPLYDAYTKANDSIESYVPFGHVFNFAKNQFYVGTYADMAFKFCTTWYSRTSYKNELLTAFRVNSSSSDGIVDFKKRFILIEADKKPTIPRDAIICSFYKYFASLYGDNKLEEYFPSQTPIIMCIVWEKQHLDFFKTFKDAVTFDDKPVLRKDVDYFDMADILKCNTYVRKGTSKSVKTVAIFDYYATSTQIDEDEYKDTLIIAPSDMSANKQNIKDLLNLVGDYNDYQSLCQILGFTHFTKCYKNSFDKFKEAGCKSLDDIQLKDRIKQFIKDNKICCIPESIYNLGELFNYSVKDSLLGDRLDLSHLWEYKGTKALTAKCACMIRNITSSSFGVNPVSKNSLESAATMELCNSILKLGEEDLMDISLIFNEHYLKSFVRYSSVLEKTVNSIFKKKLANTVTLYRDKVIDIIKNINFLVIR